MGQVERNAKDKKTNFNARGWVYYRSILALAPNIKGIFNPLNTMNKNRQHNKMTASEWVYWSRRREGHPGSCAQLVKAFWISLIKHLKMSAKTSQELRMLSRSLSVY